MRHETAAAQLPLHSHHPLFPSHPLTTGPILDEKRSALDGKPGTELGGRRGGRGNPAAVQLPGSDGHRVPGTGSDQTLLHSCLHLSLQGKARNSLILKSSDLLPQRSPETILQAELHLWFAAIQTGVCTTLCPCNCLRNEDSESHLSIEESQQILLSTALYSQLSQLTPRWQVVTQILCFAGLSIALTLISSVSNTETGNLRD